MMRHPTKEELTTLVLMRMADARPELDQVGPLMISMRGLVHLIALTIDLSREVLTACDRCAGPTAGPVCRFCGNMLCLGCERKDPCCNPLPLELDYTKKDFTRDSIMGGTDGSQDS